MYYNSALHYKVFCWKLPRNKSYDGCYVEKIKTHTAKKYKTTDAENYSYIFGYF